MSVLLVPLSSGEGASAEAQSQLVGILMGGWTWLSHNQKFPCSSTEAGPMTPLLWQALQLEFKFLNHGEGSGPQNSKWNGGFGGC